MDKIMSGLTIILMVILEVITALVEYVLYTVYLIYMSIRGKRNFKKSFTRLSKDVVKVFTGVFKSSKEILSRV